MSYAQLVENSVRLAFNQLKDLAVDAVLARRVSGTFDFTTMSSAEITAPVVIKVILTDSQKVAKLRNTRRQIFMCKTSDVGDLNQFETLTINGVVWKIASVDKNDGYVSVATIVKEN